MLATITMFVCDIIRVIRISLSIYIFSLFLTSNCKIAVATKNLFTSSTHDIGSVSNARSVFAIDLDKDGDMDVLAALYTGHKLVWYENDGSQGFTERIVRDSWGECQSVYAIDMDDDGDIDVLGTSREENGYTLSWFENDGNQAFTEQGIVLRSARSHDIPGIAVSAIDIDGDDDIDVIAAYSNGDIAWYENSGSQSFTEHILCTVSLPQSATAFFAIDIDNDGDIDIVHISNSDNSLFWRENDGNGSFTRRTITTSFTTPYSIHAADMNGDGKVDIIAGSFSGNTISWFANDGNQAFTENVVAHVFNEPTCVHAIDLDQDGDIDIVSSSGQDNMIVWYENDGSGYFSQHTVSTTDSTPYSVFSADVDGDNIIDVVSGAQSKVSWYENSASEPTPQPTLIPTASPTSMPTQVLLRADNDTKKGSIAIVVNFIGPFFAGVLLVSSIWCCFQSTGCDSTKKRTAKIEVEETRNGKVQYIGC